MLPAVQQDRLLLEVQQNLESPAHPSALGVQVNHLVLVDPLHHLFQAVLLDHVHLDTEALFYLTNVCHFLLTCLSHKTRPTQWLVSTLFAGECWIHLVVFTLNFRTDKNAHF